VCREVLSQQCPGEALPEAQHAVCTNSNQHVPAAAQKTPMRSHRSNQNVVQPVNSSCFCIDACIQQPSRPNAAQAPD
jgi:hypothetical protein